MTAKRFLRLLADYFEANIAAEKAASKRDSGEPLTAAESQQLEIVEMLWAQLSYCSPAEIRALADTL